jgi:hypothetical protein
MSCETGTFAWQVQFAHRRAKTERLSGGSRNVHLENQVKNFHRVIRQALAERWMRHAGIISHKSDLAARSMSA